MPPDWRGEAASEGYRSRWAMSKGSRAAGQALTTMPLTFYWKLQAELRSLSARKEDRRRAVEKARGRSIHNHLKQLRPKR